MNNQNIPAVPNFIDIEHQIIKFWKNNNILRQYLDKNKNSSKRFSFLDGPITANNPMGVHHAHGRTLKDFFQRYKNMQGCQQRFQNGFDCQGLWVEVEEEKDRSFNSKQEIEKFGLESFSKACRARVEKFSKIQAEQSQRLGMFMDWENSYYTMSETNNEYIWHFLKKCHEKSWLYKGIDVMPWCIRCGTAISQHELSDGGYQEVKHEAVYIKFKVQSSKFKVTIQNSKLKENTDIYLLIWTTTPWTLLSNTAVAVNKNESYVLVATHPQACHSGPRLWRGIESPAEHFVLAKSRLPVLENYKILQEFKGSQLFDTTYETPFSELPIQKNVIHRVVDAPFVNMEEGTGLVHVAPGAGKEDFDLAKQEKLTIIESLDEFGNYLEGFGKYTGKNVKNVKDDIIDDLKKQGLLFKAEQITHSYPCCWRCKEELVFRTTSEWFIKVEEIRPLMKKANKAVNWMPKFAQKRMDDWLKNMGDWPISRKRYWGLALPFYECQKCQTIAVIGSKKELRDLAVDKKLVDDLPELHRPWIDEIKIKCPKCAQEVSRVKDVGDCWLDAGIVPFSTVKYLDDKNYWQKWYPFEFITEYMAQVKLWFYATLFMSVVLENQAPWKNVLATGFVVDEKGEAMHKSKGNAIWFDEAVEKMGADVMRWMYLSDKASSNASNLRFGYNLADEVRKRFLLIFWNCYKFYNDYSELTNSSQYSAFDPSSGRGLVSSEYKKNKQNLPTTDYDSAELVAGRLPTTNLLDQWIISRLNLLVKTVTQSLDQYNTPEAAPAIKDFIINDFSTWYIRRSRDRVTPSNKNSEDRLTCLQILRHCLLILTQLMAPFMPFITEYIWQKLTDSSQYSAFDPSGSAELTAEASGRGLVSSEYKKENNNIPTTDYDSAELVAGRLPTTSIHPQDWPSHNEKLIKGKLMHQMEIVRNICEKGRAARKEARIKIRQPLAKITCHLPVKLLSNASYKSYMSYQLTQLIKEELNIKKVVFQKAKNNEVAVELDTQLTGDLIMEGKAREIVRYIQNLRKKAGCNFDDWVIVTYKDTEGDREIIETFEDYIKKEALVKELRAGDKWKIIK